MRPFASFLAVFLIAATSLFAQESEREALAREMLLLNGFDTLTEDVSRGLQNPSDQLRRENPEMAAAWARIGPRFFAPEPLFDSAVEHLAETASADELQMLADFFSTELGARVTELEVASQAPEMEEVDKVALGERLLEEMENAEARREVLERLGSAFGSEEANAAVMLNIRYALLSSLAAEGQGAMPEGDLLSFVMRDHDDLVSELERESIYRYAFVYQDLSDDEVARYAALLETDAGRKLYAAVNRALEVEIVGEIRRFGTLLGTALRAEDI
ncbi:DUF2059 domain-containing protein [Pontivivens ytuae]|uniref:DUF2059 domain-containing protein n=1 Tax=Pontivivens ytuae TaxID=2789856 RepID=A0A7S9LNP7_9RHOB|nr:DUF2059 domain-containing protein [Pontivivens ytuae]QPH52472.1 DUF2059 domain-containing protein [Pontivivens ytuae]